MGERATSVAPWMLGRTSPNKVVHRADCRYARLPYPWANRQGDAKALAEALVRNDGWRWHRPCRVCARDLIDALLDRLAVVE